MSALVQTSRRTFDHEGMAVEEIVWNHWHNENQGKIVWCRPPYEKTFFPDKTLNPLFHADFSYPDGLEVSRERVQKEFEKHYRVDKTPE